MKKYKSSELINQLQADVRSMIREATQLQSVDPGMLLKEPAAGKWSVIQVLEHLNTYGDYYLVALGKSLAADKPATGFFRPGWIGDYFTRLMLPTENGIVKNKMQAPKNHRPAKHPDAFPVLKTFLEQQHYLLELLENARLKDIGGLRTPISLTKLIRLKTGDVFRFLVAHEQRHFVQIANTLSVVQGVTGKYPTGLPAM